MPFVFPETLLVIGVDTWANVVRRLDHETYPCHISLLRYFKCRKDKKHEFLLVTITHEPTGRTAIALVDRSPENESQSSDGNSTPRLSQMASSSVNAHDQVRIKGSTDTKDVVDDYGQRDLLSTLRFTNRPTLLEFSTLLAVVHEHKPFYNPIFHQCYWHSHTIWRFFRDDKYGAVEEKKEKWSDRGVYVLIKMGRDSLEEIKAEHMVAFDSAKVEVKSRREEELARETALKDEGEARGLERGRKEGMAVAEMERLRAENAEKEKCKAEEEKRKAQEEKRKAEEEKWKAELKAEGEMNVMRLKIEEMEKQLRTRGE